MKMEADKNLAKRLISPSEAAIDTEGAEAEGTLFDIDQMARDAVVGAKGEEIDGSANRLIAKLADLNTIRRLAAESDSHPKTVGPYELLEEIGRGGMGSVYRARHRQLGKIQALKIIDSKSGMTPEVRARFRREVQAIGALQHKHIIAAHDADFEGDVPYLVMDYIAGESLAEVQKRFRGQGETLSIGAACEVVRQAAEGIQYAHEQNITHRDIKPGNLMLDHDGTVRVLDLGLARLGTQQADTEADHSELTRGNQILGTPDYMSPEQIQSSKTVDARTDVYALGATLFTLIAGKPVFASKPEESFIAKASRVLSESVPDIRKLVPTIPKELAVIIQKCLAKSPDDRLQTAGELAEVIQPWCDSHAAKGLLKTEQHVPKPKPANAPVKQDFKPKVLIGLALVAITAALIVAGVIITLKLPGGGELIVKCDDPDARIRVVAIQGGDRKDLSLTRESDNKLVLSEGRWELIIEGVDASRFELSEDEVVINDHTPTSIRITRRTHGAVTADLAARPQTQSSDRSTAAADPSLLSSSASARVFDWSQRGTVGPFRGLIVSPAERAHLPAWQIRPWLPEIQQQAHYLSENRIAIDPSGKYYAVLTRYDCKIMEIATGKILHTIATPPSSWWGGVALTRDCRRIALLSAYGGFIEIRDGNNRMLASWNTRASSPALIHETDSHGAIAWQNSGDQLLVWDDRHASLVDMDGSVQSSVSFEHQAGPEHLVFNSKNTLQRSVDSSPDDRHVAFGCTDGRVRVWDIEANTLHTLLSDREDEPITSVAWSPDGQHIGSLRAFQQNGTALEIWGRDGMIKNTFLANQLNVDVQPASQFCWSPDSRSLALGSGRIIDLDGTQLRSLDLQQELDAGDGSPSAQIFQLCGFRRGAKLAVSTLSQPVINTDWHVEGCVRLVRQAALWPVLVCGIP